MSAVATLPHCNAVNEHSLMTLAHLKVTATILIMKYYLSRSHNMLENDHKTDMYCLESEV